MPAEVIICALILRSGNLFTSSLMISLAPGFTGLINRLIDIFRSLSNESGFPEESLVWFAKMNSMLVFDAQNQKKASCNVFEERKRHVSFCRWPCAHRMF